MDKHFLKITGSVCAFIVIGVLICFLNERYNPSPVVDSAIYRKYGQQLQNKKMNEPAEPKATPVSIPSVVPSQLPILETDEDLKDFEDKTNTYYIHDQKYTIPWGAGANYMDVLMDIEYQITDNTDSTEKAKFGLELLFNQVISDHIKQANFTNKVQSYIDNPFDRSTLMCWSHDIYLNDNQNAVEWSELFYQHVQKLWKAEFLNNEYTLDYINVSNVRYDVGTLYSGDKCR